MNPRYSICLTLLLILAAQASGELQRVLITTNDENSLVYVVDDGRRCSTADDCGKYCWNRSSSITPNSGWGNAVDLFFKPAFSEEIRQIVGDWFVANYVYPHFLCWVEDGHTNRVPYVPNTENLEKIREWRKKAPEPRPNEGQKPEK